MLVSRKRYEIEAQFQRNTESVVWRKKHGTAAKVNKLTRRLNTQFGRYARGQTDAQTDKHAHYNTLQSYRRWRKKEKLFTTKQIIDVTIKINLCGRLPGRKFPSNSHHLYALFYILRSFSIYGKSEGKGCKCRPPRFKLSC